MAVKRCSLFVVCCSLFGRIVDGSRFMVDVMMVGVWNLKFRISKSEPISQYKQKPGF